jgi:hypothetical protein
MNEIDSRFTKINPSGTPQKPGALPNAPSSGKTAFGALLDEQLGKPAVTTGEDKAASLPELSGPVNALRLNPEPADTLFADKLTASLDLLESYASWLSDPEKSLKQTRALLDQLISQTDSLDALKDSRSLIDKDLEDILSRLKTTVYTEQIKFDRGDYL